MQLEEKLKRAGEISLTAYGAMQKTKETAYTWCSYLNQFSTPNRFFPGSDSYSLEQVKQKESFVKVIASWRSGEGLGQRIPFPIYSPVATLW